MLLAGKEVKTGEARENQMTPEFPGGRRREEKIQTKQCFR